MGSSSPFFLFSLHSGFPDFQRSKEVLPRAHGRGGKRRNFISPVPSHEGRGGRGARNTSGAHKYGAKQSLGRHPFNAEAVWFFLRPLQRAARLPPLSPPFLTVFKEQPPDCLPFPPFFDWSHNVPLPPPPNFHGLEKEYLSNGFSVVLCSGIQFRDKNAPPIFTTFYFHGCRFSFPLRLTGLFLPISVSHLSCPGARHKFI